MAWAPLGHRATLERRRRYISYSVRAVCQCGWASDWTWDLSPGVAGVRPPARLLDDAVISQAGAHIRAVAEQRAGGRLESPGGSSGSSQDSDETQAQRAS